MSDFGAIADAFVSARRDARGLPAYPGTPPGTLADAYAIQGRAIQKMGGRVAGWKVGKIPAPLDREHGANRLAGPIFADKVVEAAGRPAMSVFADGFAAAEAEFLLRVGTAPNPDQRHFTMDEAAALIGAVHCGIEIASSPFSGINAGGPAVTVSDFGNNHGLVVGPALGEWRDAFLDWPVQLLIDGDEIGHAKASDMLDGPIGAARFLFELLAERGIAVEPGQWISSGAVTGVHEVRPGAEVTALFGDDMKLSCTIEAAGARSDERKAQR